jgi:hypothetical protein
MSQGIERQDKAEWRPPSAWVCGAGSNLAEPSRIWPEESNCVAAAGEWLLAAPRRLAGLAGKQLIDAVARIEEAYDQFPELEIDIPRRALVDELRGLWDGAGDGPALPLLMACAALDPVPEAELVAAVLEGMVRAGRGEASARAIAILARRRAIAGDEIAPAVAELCRQGQLPAALALSAQASGDGDPEAVAVALGTGLQRLLFAGDDAAMDPSRLARTILSAQHRVQRSTRPHARDGPGPRSPTPQLLELAGRVAAKLPRQPVSPPPIAATTAPWRTGRLGFAEFAAQWPEICGVAIEWLPAMRVGRAGERRPAGLCAKPGEAGHLVYGPYVKLGAGDYRVRVHWRGGRPTRHVPQGQPVATIEVVSRYGKTYLAQLRLRAEDCLNPEHEVMFHIIGRSPPAFPVEVRVWTGGAVPLTVSSITVERIAAPARLTSTGVKRRDTASPE